MKHLPEPSTDSLDLSVILSALADPGRRAIAAAAYQDPAYCNAEGAKLWIDVLDLTAPTVSHHYRVLREAGITRTEIEGRVKRITVRADDIESRFPGLLDAVLLPASAELNLPGSRDESRPD